MNRLLDLLPPVYRGYVGAYDLAALEEVRFAVGQPVFLRFGNAEEKIWPAASEKDLEQILMNACKQSIYAYSDTLRNGFVTVEGGHRIGICGFGIVEDKRIKTIQSVSSINIRVAKQINGCANALMSYITESTLLFGPPGSGKTTMLRDIVRQLSDVKGQRVSVVDERCEISAGVFGTPQLQIGQRTDVLINIPKAIGAVMMLRTMNPQWVAMDEITEREDVVAMDRIAYCGANILATAHGWGQADLNARPLYQDMMSKKIFSKIIFLNSDKSYEVKEY